MQYDISDPTNPKLAGRVWVGGSIRKGGSVKVLGGLPEDTPEAPEIPKVKRFVGNGAGKSAVTRTRPVRPVSLADQSGRLAEV